MSAAPDPTDSPVVRYARIVEACRKAQTSESSDLALEAAVERLDHATAWIHGKSRITDQYRPLVSFVSLMRYAQIEIARHRLPNLTMRSQLAQYEQKVDAEVRRVLTPVQPTLPFPGATAEEVIGIYSRERTTP